MPETLRHLMSRGPIDPSTILNVLRQLLKALELAHWQGIVYGDIAPENILVSFSDRAIRARFADPISDGDPPRAGSPEYATPEQLIGRPATERTDIFAMGVVAYEMLIAAHPFGAADGLSIEAITNRIVHSPPREIPASVLTGLPTHIPAVLEQALAKDPKDRFRDATTFLEALQRASDGTIATSNAAGAVGAAATATSGPNDIGCRNESAVPRAGGRRVPHRRRWWIICGVMGIVVLLAVAVWLVLVYGDGSGDGVSTTSTSEASSTTEPSVQAIIPATSTTAVAPTTTTASPTTITTTTSIASSTTTTVATPTTYEQTDPRLLYTSTWDTTLDDSASGGGLLSVDSNGAEVRVVFNGTHLAWIATRSPSYGKAQITMDGRIMGTIDLYNDTTAWQQKVWGSGTLSPGLHTVTIAWTGDKSPAADGADINVDAFIVTGSLVSGAP